MSAETVEWDDLTAEQQEQVRQRRLRDVFQAAAIEEPVACCECGRAIAKDDQGRWCAVKGAERGYDPLCDAADDSRHHDGRGA
jgi:hypothetical protein